MFKDLKAEKIGDGKFLVSFTTEDPTMVHLARFFSIMSREADYFFRTIIRRQKDVDVNVTKADAEHTERLEAAKAERKRFKDRFDSMGGSRGDRIKMLRRELHLQGCPISYDSLVCALQRANRDAKEELAGRIRKLALIGRPVWAMAAELEIPVSELFPWPVSSRWKFERTCYRSVWKKPCEDCTRRVFHWNRCATAFCFRCRS